MRRLATGPICRGPDHLDTRWEKAQYLIARTRRLANKLLGLPATPQCATLALMVSKLLEATQARLGDEAVTAVVLTSPDRIRLTEEEIGDILDHLKLRNLMKGPYSLYQLYATSAAYAGHGKGLCRTYIDAYACESEESNLPQQRVLHVDFNMESLSGTIKSLQTAHDGSVDASFIDPDLGMRHKDVQRVSMTTDSDNSRQYWTTISTRVEELANSLNRVYMPHVTDLLLTGPFATDKRFQAAIRTALHGLVAHDDVLAVLQDGNDTIRDQDRRRSVFEFATARGAAEIAKRRQEGPVNCAQSDECRRRREHAHETRNLLNTQ
ncbi:hypothetical protein AMS68_007144 [Peltaster fructicola]|uniref:Uncharacterized protein n=1 Tax=Peltaster fructicola TaxID=286661 RepID=A0A6H0Y3N3_9PEZI|nr:hypothetical protein AMS68_007144 [Peltaster fructicola]